MLMVTRPSYKARSPYDVVGMPFRSASFRACSVIPGVMKLERTGALHLEPVRTDDLDRHWSKRPMVFLMRVVGLVSRLLSRNTISPRPSYYEVQLCVDRCTVTSSRIDDDVRAGREMNHQVISCLPLSRRLRANWFRYFPLANV